jgi:hypothetical protein
VLVWLGSADAARCHLDQGKVLYDRARHQSHAFVYGGHDPGVCCRKVASWAFWILGYPARGLEESLASLRLARELDHRMSIIVALVWACVFRDLRREIHEVREHARNLVAKLPEAAPLFEEFLRAVSVQIQRPTVHDRERARELADAKDVPILAAAIGEGARIFVTHNVRHFRSVQGVRVVRPRTLIEEARAWMGSFGK